MCCGIVRQQLDYYFDRHSLFRSGLCLLYASSRKRAGEGRGLVLAYQVSLGQCCVLASLEHAQQYWQLFVSENESKFNLSQNFHL